MKKSNYAPVYCAIYPDLAKIFRKHGYALAIHGSLARDFDLIAVPWADNISSESEIFDELMKEFALKIIGKPTEKLYGRRAFTLLIAHGECSIDLSFI